MTFRVRNRKVEASPATSTFALVEVRSADEPTEAPAII
jgi:hypothetical protein